MWNYQSQTLKDELIKDIEDEFGSNIFDQKKLLQKAARHLKVVRDTYRKSLVHNPKYERPPFVLVRDWNEFILDAKEKGKCPKDGTPANPKRYAIVLTTSTLMSKFRVQLQYQQFQLAQFNLSIDERYVIHMLTQFLINLNLNLGINPT
jgi:hypothetical protein